MQYIFLISLAPLKYADYIASNYVVLYSIYSLAI